MEENRVCFVIGPIGTEGSDIRKHSDKLFKEVIEPVAEELGYEPVGAIQIYQPGIIMLQVFEYLFTAKLVIADLTENNPNVFYELGFRHSAKLPVILIKGDKTPFPFDIQHQRVMTVDLASAFGSEKAKNELREYIHAIEANPDDINASLFDIYQVLQRKESRDRFTPEDVLEAFMKMPDLAHDEGLIRATYLQANELLNRNLVLSKQQLRELTTSTHVLSVLKSLYIEELLRPEQAPLDPLAVAAWGSMLFVLGTTEPVISNIRMRLRQSLEYQEKHSK